MVFYFGDRLVNILLSFSHYKVNHMWAVIPQKEIMNSHQEIKAFSMW